MSELKDLLENFKYKQDELDKIIKMVNGVQKTQNEIWYDYINSISDKITESFDTAKDTDKFFDFLQDSVDFTKPIELGSLDDETKAYYWNESVVQIWKDIEELEDWYKKFGIEGNDFLYYADAGNYFFGETDDKRWVIPWRNVDEQNYNQVRGDDRFFKALRSDANLQFTRKKGGE